MKRFWIGFLPVLAVLALAAGTLAAGSADPAQDPAPAARCCGAQVLSPAADAAPTGCAKTPCAAAATCSGKPACAPCRCPRLAEGSAGDGPGGPATCATASACRSATGMTCAATCGPTCCLRPAAPPVKAEPSQAPSQSDAGDL